MFQNGPPPPRHNPYCFQQQQQQQSQQQQKQEPKKPRLTPNQVAVIAALLTNALHVQSILIDKDQTIQVLLEGSLRQKSELDKLVDQVRDVPVGEFISSLLNNS